MSHGRLRQEKALAIIVEGKHNLDRVPELIGYVNSL